MSGTAALVSSSGASALAGIAQGLDQFVVDQGSRGEDHGAPGLLAETVGAHGFDSYASAVTLQFDFPWSEAEFVRSDFGITTRPAVSMVVRMPQDLPAGPTAHRRGLIAGTSPHTGTYDSACPTRARPASPHRSCRLGSRWCLSWHERGARP